MMSYLRKQREKINCNKVEEGRPKKAVLKMTLKKKEKKKTP